MSGILAGSLDNLPLVQDFITLFLGLIVEAFPFVVLGVLVSVLVGLFVDEKVSFALCFVYFGSIYASLRMRECACR
ncbi:MAG: hypothetical protein ACOCXP_04210 [Candidatus Dojkabacteria bacterium]